MFPDNFIKTDDFKPVGYLNERFVSYWGYGMTPRVLPFVPQTSYFSRLITSVRCCPFRIEIFTYYLLTMPTSYEKEMERLRKLLAEIETDEDSDFDNEDNGHEDILEENFSDHESFSEHDRE
ncbi:hypothetical protein AVEN_210278-1 [Araneus ventricosus]|uniref:Uncharacterized protein n=1 Tax=Araneus ventricosus TaxID=182803 RepID=A0A4Y2JUL6_ARAVE|nr:hypothetical protein AVEN_210278-1 [Araneus ventricosus]